MLVPSFLLVGVFLYYPALSGIYHAFTRWHAIGASTFVGLDNFINMASDPFLRHGAVNQIILVTADLLKALIFPFLVAEMIYHLPSAREQYWFRAGFILPIVAPTMVVVLMWYFIFDPNVGFLNQALDLLALPSFKRAWLGDPAVALSSIIGMGFPWISGLAFLIFMAGLNNLPGDVLDAARIDGSTTLNRILRIDVPMLVPQFRLVIVLTLLTSIQDFGRILVLTGGGPGFATYVPGLWMYEQTFLISSFGYASAIGLILFLVILVSSTAILRLMRSAMDH
jgi:ABC-type sugar transport system permease subunit